MIIFGYNKDINDAENTELNFEVGERHREFCDRVTLILRLHSSGMFCYVVW